MAADGRNNSEIARELGIHRNVAGKWRSRFLAHRLDGLVDEPRPGRPRTITDEQVEEMIVKTLESTPRDATHWSTRSMAREVGPSYAIASREPSRMLAPRRRAGAQLKTSAPRR